MTYEFLQQYWWFIVSLLGALLVFLLFVQGANSLVFRLGQTEDEQRLVLESTGRKWEITFTTLVTFGGAFFASFPLFYSTSFGGAYWLWMIILFSFVLQAVSYEFQLKKGNLLGAHTFRCFLVLNGVVGPTLLGGAVATFFNGSNFVVAKANLTELASPVISRWANGSAGLDALLDPWNLCLGVAVLFLARMLGALYIINNVDHATIRLRARQQLVAATLFFLVFFLAFFGWVLLKDGYAVDATTGAIVMEPMKYLHNYLSMPLLLVLTVVGVALLLYGVARSLLFPHYVRGIWPVGIGVVLVVLSLLLVAGLGATAYYPSNADLQSSLTLANSCSGLFTMRTMAIVSLLIPFVLAYIIWAWRALESSPITPQETHSSH